MKVKELTNKELDSAQNVLEKGNVSYDGFLGYDISFYNKEGKEIEPEEGSVRVEAESAPKRSADGYVADAAFERGKERQDC